MMRPSTATSLLLLSAVALLAPISTLARPQDQDEEDYPDETNELEENIPLDIPEFLSESGDVYVKAGERLKLNCQVNDMNVLIMMWFKGSSMLAVGSNVLSRDPRLHVRMLDDNAGMSIALDEFDPAKDAGQYKCTLASNPQKSLEFNVMEAVEEEEEEEEASAAEEGGEGAAEGDVRAEGPGGAEESTAGAATLGNATVTLVLASAWFAISRRLV